MRLKIVLSTLVAAGAFASVAVAEDGPGRPDPADRAAQRTEQVKQRAEQRAEKLKQRAAERSEKLRQRAAEHAEKLKQRAAERAAKRKEREAAKCGPVLVAGTVTDVATGAFTVQVKHSNRKRLKGTSVTFEVKEQMKLRGKMRSGALADGMHVLVHARGCTSGERLKLVALKVHVRHAKPAKPKDDSRESDDSDESGDDESDGSHDESDGSHESDDSHADSDADGSEDDGSEDDSGDSGDDSDDSDA